MFKNLPKFLWTWKKIINIIKNLKWQFAKRQKFSFLEKSEKIIIVLPNI